MPESGPRERSVASPAVSISNSESSSFCLCPCSAEGRGQCQGLPADPVPARASGLPHGVLSQVAGAESTPFHAHPGFPVQFGEESTLLHSRNCKIKFPRCSGPRSSRVLSGEEMGIGESRAHFLPAHPAFPVPPSTARAVNQPASAPATWSSPPPAPTSPASLLTAEPRAAPGVSVGSLGGVGEGHGRASRCPIGFRPVAGAVVGQTDGGGGGGVSPLPLGMGLGGARVS